MDARKFDIDLFLALNAEYAQKRVAAPSSDPAVRAAQSVKRADRLERMFKLDGKRVVELGCGRGELAHELAAKRGCQVVAVDISPYPEWAERQHPALTFMTADLSAQHDIPAGSVDLIYSFSVMEHVRHPFAMLRACRDLLTEEGRFLLVAHLYRSASGSHRSREVFFPWPHLLFTEDVFEEFYRRSSRPPMRPAWLNKLTYADYFRYFDLLGLQVVQEFKRQRELDEAFYQRFEDELSRYALFDLKANAVEVVLARRPEASSAAHAEGRARAQLQSVDRWAYFDSAGELTRQWQRPRRLAVSPVPGAPRWLRMESADAEPVYLATSGGSFSEPPGDPAAWSVAPATRCRVGLSLDIERGKPAIELWVIEYGDEGRLRHTRRALSPGVAELEWRTSPSTRSIRLALRVQGPGAAVVSSIAFASEG